MLNRERVGLQLLEEAGGHLAKTVFVKLMFLIRMETALKKMPSFYDFVPYKYGPHSFSLYRDLIRLRSYGYTLEGQDFVALNASQRHAVQLQTKRLSNSHKRAIAEVADRYGKMKVSPLIKDVYDRYRWYALNSERPERSQFSIPSRPTAPPAVYTIGYEGKTVDAFFNYLLWKGISSIIDIRANPVSRKFGFAGSRLKQIGGYLGLEYQHFPSLGVPSSERANLSDMASRMRLFTWYERTTLVKRTQQIEEVGRLMRCTPSVLVCIERDFKSCHRSRLARVLANETGMEEIHL